MAYAKRYAGGFADKPTLTTPIDSQFLNAVEAALLELLSTDGTVDGQALQWIAASSKFGPALILNKNIDPAAAIDKSKLNLAGQIGNADIAGAAAIDRSKLNFGAGLVNADIAAAAAIAISKLANYPTDGTKVLRGDGSWKTGGIDTIFDVVVGRGQSGDPATPINTIDSNTILGGNIPQTYKHLRLVVSARTDYNGANSDFFGMFFNNDRTASYDTQRMRGAGAAASSAELIASTVMTPGMVACQNAVAGSFGMSVIEIPNYTDTNTLKQVISTSTVKQANSTGNLIVETYGGFWRSTAAVTRLGILTYSGGTTFVAGSRLTLYGLN